MYNFNKSKTSKPPVKKKPGFMKKVAAKMKNLGGKLGGTVARSMPADQIARGKMGETY